jgi:O-antigen/teichoic acid export membrane protein
MERRRVLVNAVSSLVQVIVISAVLFIQYGYLLRVVGASGLGIWSLVLATTAVTQFANLGLSGSVVKFVAKYLARNDPDAVVRLLQTAVTTVGVLMAVALALAYPLLRLALRLVVAAESLPAALALLPWALAAFWLLVVAGVFQAGFDGLQRLDIRSGLLIAAALLHLILCFLLVPRFGLVGLGYARVLQNSVTLLAGLVLLKRRLPGLPLFPRRWDKSLFREMFGYGVNFQAISLLNMLYDPVTKGLLSRFGGLSLVGFYEMASRMVQQTRSLLASANQALIPFIAHVQELAPERVKAVYRTSYDLMFYLSLPVFTALAVGAPLISVSGSEPMSRTFVASTAMLSAACWVSALSARLFLELRHRELRPTSRDTSSSPS